jgi:hypothetical protein
MDLSPLEALNDPEKRFAMLIGAEVPRIEAFRQVYDDLVAADDDPERDEKDQAAAEAHAARPHVARFLKMLETEDTLEIAERIFRDQLLLGGRKERLQAATAVLARDSKERLRSGAERWLDLMLLCGAEVKLPVAPGTTEVTVALKDLVDGRAQLSLPLAGKLELLRLAGAPWNDSLPDSTLSPIQVEVLGRRERLKILHGGSGLGKSVLGGCETLCELALPNHRSAIISDTYDHCADDFAYAYQGFVQLFGEACAVRLRFERKMVGAYDMEILPIWGSSVRCYSTGFHNGDAILGKEFDYADVAEAGGVSFDVWARKIKRALNRRAKKTRWGHQLETGRATMYTTPGEEGGCSGEEYDRVQKQTRRHPETLHAGACPWVETVYIREANVLENPSYSREVFEAERKQLVSMGRLQIFEEQYEGRMTRRAGLILKSFDAERHCRDAWPAEAIRGMRLGVGIDTGKHFAALLAGLDRQVHLHFLDEVYTREQSISENAEEVKRMVVELLSPAFGVAPRTPMEEAFEALKERIDFWFVDSASQHKEDLIEHLDVAIESEQLELLSTLDALDDAFRDDVATITEECQWLKWEIGRYRWQSVAAKKGSTARNLMPRQWDDHAIDAARFVAVQLLAAGPLEVAAKPSTFEDAFERQQRHEVFGHLVESLQEPKVRHLGDAYRRVHG